MVGFCIMAPLSETFVKILGASLPLMFVVMARFLAPVFLMRRSLWNDRHQIWARRDLSPLIVIRSILHLLAIACFFMSLRYLPLADALAIAYVMPFMILAVGWGMGEPATKLQAVMCFIGFLGAMMVVQPSFASVGWPAFLPLAVAFLFTGFVFITRKLTRFIDPIDLQALNGTVAVSVILPVLLIGTILGWTEAQFVTPDTFQIICLLGVGVLGTIGHLSMTWALKVARPSTLAPVQYLEIPFGALFGILFFSEFPNGLAAIGIIIVISAGILVLVTSPKTS